ncbi:hypothetical protein AB1M95_17230 [Sulfitobacter sp. LCG007]
MRTKRILKFCDGVGVAFAAALAFPAPLLALSCPPQQFDSVWSRASQSEASYVVVRGQFDFDPALNPEPDATATGTKSTEFISHFRGEVGGPDGFDKPVALNLTVSVTCMADACGRLEPRKDAIAFLREDGETYVLETGPCGDFLFQPPLLRTEERLKECFAGAECPEE